MTTDTRHNGTIRSDFEADFTRLNNFPTLTSDSVELLHRLIKNKSSMSYCDVDNKKGTLESLLKNHILTVLCEISRKNLEGDAFADAQGTVGQNRYAQKLERDIKEWMARLEKYLHSTLVVGDYNSPVTELTHKLYDLLEKSLPQTDQTDSYDYYRMFRTITAIQSNIKLYIQQVEQNGDTEPALALLLVFLRNYGQIVESFNQQFAELPAIYYKNILHCVPKASVPDNVYLVVNPVKGNNGFSLPIGTSFTVDENLVYKTTQEESVSPLKCVGLNAICNHSDSASQEVYRQIIHIDEPSVTDRLFIDEEKIQMGWQLESPMFVVNEGRRELILRFLLTSCKQITFGDNHHFVLQYSSAEGWTSLIPEINSTVETLDFSFSIETDGAVPVACTEKVHGIVSEYPVVRILTDRMNQLDITFSAVEVQINVTGIRNFTLRNELGGADTTQPFSLFGVEAERGSWFTFGNEEMGVKPLQEVSFKGKWKKMPETKEDFDMHYQGYDINADSFMVSTEYMSKENWCPCLSDKSGLLRFDEEGNLLDVEINFNFPVLPEEANNDCLDKNRSACGNDGFFRATLTNPKVGFGSSAYRKLFSDVMIYNSRPDHKEHKALPEEPLMPMLADVELSYTTAPVMITLGNGQLKPIMFSESPNTPPREGMGRLLPKFPAASMLFFAFEHAVGERNLRMYVDLVLPPGRIPYTQSEGSGVQLEWAYWNGKDWKDVPSKSVTAEETNGFKQSGFIEINLDERISRDWIDSKGKMWLRVAVKGDINSCMGVRGVWTNCIKVTATGGNGASLPAGTITEMTGNNACVESVLQPLPGFGGLPAETDLKCFAQRTARLHNRHRAVTTKDFEEIVLEHFSEVDKVQCFSVGCEKGASKTFIVVFSRQEDNRYFLSSPWKLAEIERTIKEYASPFSSIQVLNPVYKKTDIRIKARLRKNVKDEGKVVRQLTKLAESYLIPWFSANNFPDLEWNYSYNALRARLANHEDVDKLLLLTVNGESPSPESLEGDVNFGKFYPWDVLLPKITIELLPYTSGIGEAEIEGNFIAK